jgi:hypothetical protein
LGFPPWGDSTAFFGDHGRLIPIGSAFSVGSGVSFLLSAAHNLYEVVDHELRLQHLANALTLAEAIKVSAVANS